MTTKETDEEFWARVAELPYAEQDRAQLVRQIDALRAENQRLRAVVATMRAAQKRYFKERTQSALVESKRLEKEVDALLA